MEELINKSADNIEEIQIHEKTKLQKATKNKEYMTNKFLTIKITNED